MNFLHLRMPENTFGQNWATRRLWSFPNLETAVNAQGHLNVQETHGIGSVEPALVQHPQTLTTQGWHTGLKSYGARLTWTTGSWEGYSRTSQLALGTRRRRCSWAYCVFFHTPIAYISSQSPWNSSVELNHQRPCGWTGRKINKSTFI